MKLLSIGEVLWDIFGDREHLGGAALNFAHHMARLGHQVAILSGVADDERGCMVLDFLENSGVETTFIQAVPGAETGKVEVRVNGGGRPSYRLQRPAAYDLIQLDNAALSQIADWNPDWIYFGTLFHKDPIRLEDTLHLLNRCSGALTFYDVNLRESEYTDFSIRILAQRARMLKLNEAEVPVVGRILDCGTSSEDFLRLSPERYGYGVVCITRGDRGCILNWHGEIVECEATPVDVVDTVGAGDAFAAALLHGWSEGWGAAETGRFASLVAGMVASRAGAAPLWSPSDLNCLMV